MTSLYSRHDSSFAWSESEPEEEYGVYWKTDSILAHESLPSNPIASTSALPINKTPNSKRTTTIASLPSPSASVAATEDGPAPVRALRDRKKPRAVRAKAGAKASSASPVTIDQSTLLAIGRLEKRLSARRPTNAGASGAEGRGTKAGPAGTGLVAVGKGKQKELVGGGQS